MNKLSYYINHTINNKFFLTLLSFLVFNIKNILRIKEQLKKNEKKLKILNVGQVHSPHYKNLNNSRVQFLKKIKVNYKIFDICSYPIINKRKIFNCSYYDYIDYSFHFKVNYQDWHKNLIVEAKNNLKPVTLKILNLIKIEQPDIIWIHDLQSGGYLLNQINYPKKNIRIILTIYGNDLYFYKDNIKHKINILKLLTKIDCLHVETSRDANMARELGYCGEIAQISSATLKILNLEPNNCNLGKFLLMIRGSMGYENRTNLNGLKNFLLQNKNFICNKNIIMYCANNIDIIEFRKLSIICNFKIEFLGFLSAKEINKLYKNSNYHISATLSDGVANTCVEAVQNGCIPIITVHNGFSELIDECYKKYLVYDINFKNLANNLFHLENNLILKNEIINSLVLVINNYFSNKSTEQALIDIFNSKI